MRSMVLSLVVILSIPTQANEIQLRDLNNLYGQCKTSLDSCKLVHTETKQLGKDKNEAIKFLREENKDLRKKKDHFLANPYLWGAVGIILGVVITK